MGDYSDDLFGIIASILLIGNIKYDSSTLGNAQGCSIVDHTTFTDLSYLLGMSVIDTQRCITMKSITIG